MLLVLVLIAVQVWVGCVPCCSISCSVVVWPDFVPLVVLVLLLAVELVPALVVALQVVVAMLLLLVVLQRELFFSLSVRPQHSDIMGCGSAPSELLWDSGGFPPRRRFQEVTENRAEGGGGG